MKATLFIAGMLVTSLMAQPAQAEIEFGIPTPMPDQFNVVGANGYPWVSEDGLEMYISSSRNNPGSAAGGDLFVTHRDSVTDPWGTLVDLGAPVNSADHTELGAMLTADGQELYFTRTLSPFGLPESELYVSHRQPDDSWGDPMPLSEINTPEREAYPSISADGLTLYFGTVANPNYPSPNGLPWSTWVANRSSQVEPFGTPEFFFDGYGTVTPDGLTHILLGYPDVAEFYGVPNVGDGDLYIRTRSSVDEEFGPLRQMKPPVSGSGQLLAPPLTGVGLECCAWISPADATLYFSAIRPGPDKSGAVGFVDLWQAPIAESVPIDVNPGGGSESIDLRTETMLSAAILSTDAFNALEVDEETLLFGDPLMIADGASPVSPLSTSSADVNGDGLPDMTLELSIPEMQANGVIGLLTEQGYFAGELLDGTIIAGRDNLSFVPEPSSLLLILVGLLAVTICRRGNR